MCKSQFLGAISLFLCVFGVGVWTCRDEKTGETYFWLADGSQ